MQVLTDTGWTRVGVVQELGRPQPHRLAGRAPRASADRRAGRGSVLCSAEEERKKAQPPTAGTDSRRPLSEGPAAITATAETSTPGVPLLLLSLVEGDSTRSPW